MQKSHALAHAHARYSSLALALALAVPAAACAPVVRKQSINPPGAQRLAPYSTAVRSGSLVFFSGVIGMRPGGAGLPDGTEAQVQQALENLRANLTAAGLEPRDVVKCTVFL